MLVLVDDVPLLMDEILVGFSMLLIQGRCHSHLHGEVSLDAQTRLVKLHWLQVVTTLLKAEDGAHN